MQRRLHAVQPGLPDPALDAQRIFRRVLEAMARPGRIVTVDGVDTVAPLYPASVGVALTLLDHETPLYLDDAARTAAAKQHLRFHCGCPLVDDPDRAMFAILADAGALLPLERFSLGSDEYPDHGATVIVQVTGLVGGEGLRLRGPGIDGEARLGIHGVPDNLPLALTANHARFPRGVDLLFCCGAELAALPRSTTVEE